MKKENSLIFEKYLEEIWAVPINSTGNQNTYAGQSKSDNPYKQNVKYGRETTYQGPQLSIEDISAKLTQMGEPGLAELVGKYKTDKNMMWYLSLAANGDQKALSWLKQKFIHAQPVR